MSLPGFEGYEKRLEVGFACPLASQGMGLRAMARAEIDAMLKAAECTIVSQLSNEHFDSYVLSESSLFIYPRSMVIKTCGTTQLLQAVPVLLDSASRLQLRAVSCRYTRGSFNFPAVQPYPHNSFREEVRFLDRFFGHLGGRDGGEWVVMGREEDRHKWHVYYAVEEGVLCRESDPVYTVEMCMTQLDTLCASQFQKSVLPSALEMTKVSGIADILPGSKICDFAFDICGYSMNGMEGAAYSTIHVTPEDAFSYASFEAQGYNEEDITLQALLDRAAAVFRPEVFSVAVFVTGDNTWASTWNTSAYPRGYFCDRTFRKELSGGSVVVYHTFRRSSIWSGSSIAPMPLLPQQTSVNVDDDTTKTFQGLDDDGSAHLFLPFPSSELNPWTLQEKMVVSC